MPAAYAHHRFGQACLDRMPEKLKLICEKYRELFDFGVHGPDLLFYYNPLGTNEVNSYGSELHHWTGAQFFEICKYVYNGMDGQLELTKGERHALLAYILGFLAHFTLDSCCHGYINKMTEETDMSHNYIESQYEAYLMLMDEKDPLEVDRSLPLKPSKRNAKVVANLFPFEPEQILKSMKGQQMVLHLFYSPAEIKKHAIQGLIGKMKMKGDFGDLFLDSVPDVRCEEINEGIIRCHAKAVGRYPEMLRNFVQYINGKDALNEYFNYDFEGELHE